MENRQNTDVKTIFDFLRITPLVSIGLGFVFTAMHFISIGYFPQNDINSFISIFIYITITWLIVIGFIPFLSYLAVIFWIRSTFNDPNMSRLLLKPDEIEPACLISFNNKTDDLNQAKNITRKILIYYAISMSAVIPAILIATSHLTPQTASAIVAINGLLLFGSSIFFSSLSSWTNAIKNQGLIKKYILSTEMLVKKTSIPLIGFLIKYSINTLISSLLLSNAIILFLYISPVQNIPYNILAVIILIYLSTAWFASLTESDNQPKTHFMIVIAFFMIILMLTQGKIITTTLTLSKLGSFDTNLFVDHDTCTMFNSLDKKVVCSKTGLTMINSVTVKWRGTDEYVTFITDTKPSRQRYLIIPSSEIHGMGSQLT